jgi:hypothetical protein
LENGLAASSGISFDVESADSSENRITASAWIEPSVPIDSAALAWPRRMASTPSWIAVAPEAQAVESVIGEPCVPNSSASRSAMVPNRKFSCSSPESCVAAASSSS